MEKTCFLIFLKAKKALFFLFLLRNLKVRLNLKFTLKVKINKAQIRSLDIEKEILGGYIPILVPMSCKTCKSSITLEIGKPVNTLGFKSSFAFQSKPKFVWSKISL